MIFNRRIKRIQQSRSALNPLSKKVDYLKDEVADRMADRFLDIKRHFPKVLDMGSGAGHLIKFIDPECISKIVQMDSSQELLYRDVDIKYPIEQERIVGDIENMNLPDEEYDAVVSTLALHWVNDLPGALIQARKCLKPDGVFIGCLFGGDTLYELRTSLQLAETERDGGISPHVSPMVKHQDMGALLSRAGFNLTTG
jgi:NADH dehydrogenase [ubiquinone] 1 alpha subcomplex assembly factor 5